MASSDLKTNASACAYMPEFFPSSPYVTAVGSTFGPESGYPERASQADRGGGLTSGGGFSFYNPRPSWQNKAVEEYLREYPYGGGFNSGGRGYPDVSLLSLNTFTFIWSEEPITTVTASGSAVLFAAMVSLVNAARISRGKGPIGFLNVILYKEYQYFVNDITVGNNSCSSQLNQFGAVNCCEGLGFQAAEGWDPVTGWGSINFRAFKNYLESLGGESNNGGGTKNCMYCNRRRSLTTTNSTTSTKTMSTSVTESTCLA